MPLVFGEVTARVESSLAHTRRTASSIERGIRRVEVPWLSSPSFFLGDVEEGGELRAELAGGEVGEVADLRQDLTERADNKAESASLLRRVQLRPQACRVSRRVSLRPCGNPRLSYQRALICLLG